MPAVVTGRIEAVVPDRRVVVLGGRELLVPEPMPFESWLREGVSVTAVYEEQGGQCVTVSLRRTSG